jgi:hypothetical protein
MGSIVVWTWLGLYVLRRLTLGEGRGVGVWGAIVIRLRLWSLLELRSWCERLRLDMLWRCSGGKRLRCRRRPSRIC